MTLTASLAEPLVSRQTANSLVEEPSAEVSDLVDLLANRLGAQALYRANGFVECPPFGAYVADDFSICMTRLL